MNILHLNQSDTNGGAAIAGYRLHQGLLTQGIGSKMLVGRAETTSDRVAPSPRKYRVDYQLTRVGKLLGLNYVTLISSFDILKHPFCQEADVLNFHNLHTGYFNYLSIPSLTQNKPTIFTLHDMWSFTGHCSYSYDCDRWKTGCGQCPYPEMYPAIQRDNTRLEWKLKNWVYEQSKLTIVAPSHWLTEQAQQSMLGRFPIYHIPNGLDTDLYQPLDPEQCRTLLGIPLHKKVLMFAAFSLKELRKGSDLLLKALQNLPSTLKAETVLLTIGNGGDKLAELIGIPTFNLGYVTGDRLKAIAYSAADLFIFPTKADNLPLVLQESMACGTPMVSFKTGGVPDMVRPGQTGYLATPADANDFCQGIVQLLENEDLRDRMRQRCREIAVAEYSSTLQAQRYMELYHQVLQV